MKRDEAVRIVPTANLDVSNINNLMTKKISSNDTDLHIQGKKIVLESDTYFKKNIHLQEHFSELISNNIMEHRVNISYDVDKDNSNVIGNIGTGYYFMFVVYNDGEHFTTMNFTSINGKITIMRERNNSNLKIKKLKINLKGNTELVFNQPNKIKTANIYLRKVLSEDLIYIMGLKDIKKKNMSRLKELFMK